MSTKATAGGGTSSISRRGTIGLTPRLLVAGGLIAVALSLKPTVPSQRISQSIIVLGIAICVLAGVRFRVFILAGIGGLAVSYGLITFEQHQLAQRVGDLAFFALATGTLISMVPRS
jgi:hypothetical protein